MASVTTGWAGGDGIQYGSRVTQFNYAKELATVVDAILNSLTTASRLLYMAEDFNRATLLKTVKISRRNQGQWVTGLEPLNSAAENVTIQMQFNRTLYSMPKVNILAEAFARQYDVGVDYDRFEYEDILDEVLQDLSSAAVAGTGTGAQPNSLDILADDGVLYDVVGGVSRATYSAMKGTNTSFSAVGSLSKFATMYSAISDTGPKEAPTIMPTTFAVFDFVEQLYNPVVKHEYKTLPIGGRYPKVQDPDGMGMGFQTMDWRGIPIIRDKAIASGVGYMLNENYLCWYGDAQTPEPYRDFLTKVTLGKGKVKEGQAELRPSDYHGFFFQEEQMMPNAGGIIGRFWISGQLVSFQPRRLGRWSGFTGI